MFSRLKLYGFGGAEKRLLEKIERLVSIWFKMDEEAT